MSANFSDAERLDFFDECDRRINQHYGTAYRWRVVINHNVNRLMLGQTLVDLLDDEGSTCGLSSCREAIDAKMRECGRTPRSAQPPTPQQADTHPQQDQHQDTGGECER